MRYGRTTARRAAASGAVARRLVLERHDPPLRPGPGQSMDVFAERRVARMLGEDVEGPLDVLRERPRQDLLELLEGGGEVRVVLVGVADHQPRRQDDGHRLVEGQLERRQELLADDAPQPVLRPDRDADLGLERAQVAIDGPRRDARRGGRSRRVGCPSGWPRRTATTRSIRASRSRLPNGRSAPSSNGHGAGG